MQEQELEKTLPQNSNQQKIITENNLNDSHQQTIFPQQQTEEKPHKTNDNEIQKRNKPYSFQDINQEQNIEKELKEKFQKQIQKEQQRRKDYGEEISQNIEVEVSLSKKKHQKTLKEKQKMIQIGINDKMLMRIQEPQYITDILRIPVMSFLFNEIDFNKALKENSRHIREKKKSNNKKVNIDNGKPQFTLAKPKKGEVTLTITARMSKVDGSYKIVKAEEILKNYQDVQLVKKPKVILSEEKLQKMNEKILLNWKKVSKSIISYRKYFMRTDTDQNAKKVALMCQKEWKKNQKKVGRNVNDIYSKIKKLHKEVIIFQKKKQKDIQELKKKRQKIEIEIQKKEEEKRDELKQKRKIEFLIKQSGIYADFMASKLGQEKHPKKELELIKLTNEEKQQAEENVHNLITDLQKKNHEFDKEIHDFSKVEIGEKSQLVETPKNFKGTLKIYQIKGLRWLDNLYSQGINGILADEMGLGKTIQALALMCHLAEKKNNYGPFLVIAPTITLHNWYSELKRFCPILKVLPYWGHKKDRKIIKKYFQQKYVGKKSSPFHVFITSYQLAVSDEKTLQRVKWQYIILDEAQAIKNIQSQRWNTLLSFKSRNKLLLTGTPIQNTMAELWALLHFIMPQLFDSHEQFKEWFSRNIEDNENEGELKQRQLDRLHAILKPFMLRRVKKDVEKELGKKIENKIYCNLSQRQRKLYNRIKSKIPIENLFHLKQNKEKVQNLMNLVMQFRKVCNHPDLFERKQIRCSLIFDEHYFYPQHYYYSSKLGMNVIVGNYDNNPLNIFYPKLIQDFEFEMKKIKTMNFLIFDQLYYWKNLTSISQLEFDFYTFPTMQNLLQLITYYHYINHQQKQLLEIKEKKINFKIQIKPINILNNIFIENILASTPKIYQYQPKQNISYKLFLKSQVKNFIHEFPSFRNLINDSSKLKYLENLLQQKSEDGDRVLIFCQMTKMMDILEEFLVYKKYVYLRLDGATAIDVRRDMVEQFQQNDNVFVFLLSTRAGGLGVTLTKADSVIFYDNDWNPTMDEQAIDRAHRIGRRENIQIYKLITKNTIEERIVKRAEQKKHVQQTLYSGEVFKGNVFKPNDVVDLLLDDELIENKDLRNKKALLHVKKTGNLKKKEIIEKQIKEKKAKKQIIEKKQKIENEKKEEKIQQPQQSQQEIQEQDKLQNEFNNLLEEFGGHLDLTRF